MSVYSNPKAKDSEDTRIGHSHTFLDGSKGMIPWTQTRLVHDAKLGCFCTIFSGAKIAICCSSIYVHQYWRPSGLFSFFLFICDNCGDRSSLIELLLSTFMFRKNATGAKEEIAKIAYVFLSFAVVKCGVSLTIWGSCYSKVTYRERFLPPFLLLIRCSRFFLPAIASTNLGVIFVQHRGRQFAPV